MLTTVCSGLLKGAVRLAGVAITEGVRALASRLPPLLSSVLSFPRITCKIPLD
jgi:hypothetical protein